MPWLMYAEIWVSHEHIRPAEPSELHVIAWPDLATLLAEDCRQPSASAAVVGRDIV